MSYTGPDSVAFVRARVQFPKSSFVRGPIRAMGRIINSGLYRFLFK